MKDIRVMLVDDEERFLVTTQKFLARKGMDALIAKSGEEALDLLEKNAVHVVVLDVKMPGMDGIQTLKAIKARFPLVEVIMLTGHATVETAVEGLKFGAADYVMKPCDIGILLEKAREAYGKRVAMENKLRMAEECKATEPPQDIVPGKEGS